MRHEKWDEFSIFLEVLVVTLLVIQPRVFQMARIICDLIFGPVSGLLYFSHSA
jgi:hypothetical protein